MLRELNINDVPSTPPPREPNPVTAIPNNQAELFQGFDNAVSNVEPFQYTRVHDFSLPRTPTRGYFFLYPIFDLPKYNPDYDEELKILRYVVTTDFKLLFAKDGRASSTIPFHTEMASACLAAGDVFINENNKIVAINNSSGHFRPDWTSMVFLLGILINHGDYLADNLRFNFYGTTNEITVPVYELFKYRKGEHIETNSEVRNIQRNL